jgi:hypothetical protein
MAWKRRGNRLYFYRIVRERGKVRAIYVGTGPDAESLHAQNERQRIERCAQQRHRDHLQTQTASPQQLNTSSSLLTDAAFLLAGYWQHAHGDWRRKHDGQQS